MKEDKIIAFNYLDRKEVTTMGTFLTRYDPFRDWATLQDRMDRMFDDVLTRLRGEPGPRGVEGGWSPAVDIAEPESDIVLKADLPGVDPKDVDIQVQDGLLPLRGERKFEADTKEDNYRRLERVYGSFTRSFSLPPTVDADQISADYRNGVLQVTLPKRAEAKPKQIKVAVKS